ncbi:protein of unknown function [Methylocella tundrae]|uniref:Uncharacterized protein n=1 Tax=Methylocella tundrae TaxID=227605 RepID=A0A4U8YZV9_METTU|nr:protein of unknown function [Methylocella tundrae]
MKYKDGGSRGNGVARQQMFWSVILKFFPDCAMGARPARRLASASFLQFGYKLLRKIHSAGRFWTLR